MTTYKEFTITAGLLDAIGLDDSRLEFVVECCERFERADYGVISDESKLVNQQVIADGQGTVIGFYDAGFDTRDFANQVWVARDYHGGGRKGMVTALLPSER